jgi:hypothetical protein
LAKRFFGNHDIAQVLSIPAWRFGEYRYRSATGLAEKINSPEILQSCLKIFVRNLTNIAWPSIGTNFRVYISIGLDF